MPDDDNRILLQGPPISFPGKFGDTGQDHDNYPAPNTQARFDLMRSYLIGVLANQSSDETEVPTEKRTGTLWFIKNLALMALSPDGQSFDKVLANYIGVDTGEDDPESLQDVLVKVLADLNFVGPRIIWSGFFTTDEINQIVVPEKFNGYAAMSNMRALVYVDGILLDPRITEILVGNPTVIKINEGFDPQASQRYTVILEHVTEIEQETIPARG